MVEISPENISGFVAGEGCFYVESAFDENYKLKHKIRPAFCIELRADDREILEAIRNTLQCGKIYNLNFGRYLGYEQKNWRPHVKFRVGKHKELFEKVIPFFERYPLFGNKLKAFKLFKEIVKRIVNEEHLNPQGLETLKILADQLKAANKKGYVGLAGCAKSACPVGTETQSSGIQITARHTMEARNTQSPRPRQR